MQENEFEKQVKQKMDEFRLRPSEPVWLEVRKELEKKRRRRMLLFLPLFAVLLAGGYFTWQSVFPEKELLPVTKEVAAKNENDNKTNPSTNNDKTIDPLKKTEHKKDITDPVAGKAEKAADEKKNEEVNSNKELAVNKTGVIKKEKLAGNKNTGIASAGSLRKNVKDKGRHDFSVQTNTIGSVKKIAGDHSSKTGNELVSNIDNKKISKSRLTDTSGNAQLLNDKTLVENSIVSNDRSLVDNTPILLTSDIQRQIIADSIFGNRLMNVQVPAINNKNFTTQRALKIGFTFAIGASSRANKPLQIVNSSSAEKNLASPLGVSGGSGQLNFNGGVLVLPPSEVKPGVAFKAGITVMKSVSKRFDISSGLLYSYSSDHIQVGKSLNYSVNYSASYSLDLRNQSSYANVQSTNYTNKYHFIELPVSLSYNLTRKWRSPLTWNAGVSLSRLISTNALLYDAAWGGVYYDGKNDINKTQFNISTGFSWRFNGHNGWQWNIGPQLYVSATRLFNNTYDENKHPLYGGLHMQVLLPSKKKSK